MSWSDDNLECLADALWTGSIIDRYIDTLTLNAKREIFCASNRARIEIDRQVEACSGYVPVGLYYAKERLNLLYGKFA